MKYPNFITEEEFRELHEGLSEIDILKQFSQNLKLIHKLTTSHYVDFDALLKDYLQAGLKIFEMKYGIISEIKDGDYIIRDAVSPDDTLHKGDLFQVEGTYCREVVNTGKIIGFPHVGNIEEMKNHPVYIGMKLESYLSAPIYVNDKIFGTLNFSSTEIREHGFSEQERELIGMMANSIGNFLLLKDKEEKLQKSYKRIRKLTNFVAHDLRTPLGNISSLSELIPELDEEEEKEERREMLELIKQKADQSLEIVHTILEAAMVGEGNLKLSPSPTRLDHLISQSLSNYENQFKQASLEVISNIQNIEIELDKDRMLQVFNNLFSNITKYSKPETSVQLNLVVENNKCIFRLQNTTDSSKIRQRGLDVTDKGSLGYGLEIVEEILRAHGSDLKIENDQGLYISTFELDLTKD